MRNFDLFLLLAPERIDISLSGLFTLLSSCQFLSFITLAFTHDRAARGALALVTLLLTPRPRSSFCVRSILYRDQIYSIGVQRSQGQVNSLCMLPHELMCAWCIHTQGFLAADVGTNKEFDGRAYYQWDKHVDGKVQCMVV